MSGYGGQLDRAAAKRRRKGQTPGPVSASQICPTCGVAHRSERGNGSGVAALDARALQILKRHSLDELAASVRAKAEPEHIADVVRVLDRIDRRLAKIED